MLLGKLLMNPLLMHATIATTKTKTIATATAKSEIINWMDYCARICTVLDVSLVVQQIILHAKVIPSVYLAI